MIFWLKDDPNLDTAEKIENALKEKAQTKFVELLEENIAVYDAELMVDRAGSSQELLG